MVETTEENTGTLSVWSDDKSRGSLPVGQQDRDTETETTRTVNLLGEREDPDHFREKTFRQLLRRRYRSTFISEKDLRNKYDNIIVNRLK